MKQNKVVEDSIYKGRKMIISFVDQSEIRNHIKKIIKKEPCFLNDYHNGYIELKNNETENTFQLTEKITYNGKLEHLGLKQKKKFIGFDTTHSWNFENPRTQSKEAVIKMCKKLIEEMEKTK